jgi:hypothetical protein
VSFALLAVLNLALLVRSYRRYRRRAATRPAPPPLAWRTRLTIALAVAVFITGFALTDALGTRDNAGSHTLDVVAPLVGWAALWFAWRAYHAERPSARTRRGRRP